MLWTKEYRHEHLLFLPPREGIDPTADEEKTVLDLRMMGPARTVMASGFPIAAAGIVVFREKVGEAWFRGSLYLGEYARSVARVVKRQFEVHMIEHGLHRVEITAKVSDSTIVRFAEFMGFEREGVCRQLGSDKADYFMMSRIR